VGLSATGARVYAMDCKPPIRTTAVDLDLVRGAWLPAEHHLRLRQFRGLGLNSSLGQFRGLGIQRSMGKYHPLGKLCRFGQFRCLGLNRGVGKFGSVG
jgi:hypothetical protein